MSAARHALRRYNDDHPGQELDAFWPVMEESVHFQGQSWVHANFLARRGGGGRTIRRFFAELCYHDCSAPPTVHACTIIGTYDVVVVVVVIIMLVMLACFWLIDWMIKLTKLVHIMLCRGAAQPVQIKLRDMPRRQRHSAPHGRRRVCLWERERG